MDWKYRQGDYLFHGSPHKIEVLQPMQAYDTGFEAGCRRAVYATDNPDMAICFALGVEGDETSERTMLPEYGMKMLFRGCHPRYGQKGYVYVLDKAGFVHAMGSQWVSCKEQKPIDVIEINVDDYIQSHCMIVEGEKQRT